MTTRVIVRWLLLGTAAAPGALSCRLLPGFGTWTKRLGQGLNKGCTIVSCPSCLLDRLYIRVSAARRSVLCLLCSGSHAAAQLLQAPIAPARVLALVHVDWYWCIICSKACVVTIAGGSFNTGGRARRLIVQRTERKEPRRSDRQRCHSNVKNKRTCTIACVLNGYSQFTWLNNWAGPLILLVASKQQPPKPHTQLRTYVSHGCDRLVSSSMHVGRCTCIGKALP